MNLPPGLNVVVKKQEGVLKRQQALALGIGEEAIRHALGPRGSWQKIMPGVYATFTGPLHEKHRLHAALLWAGPEAALTGAHACRRYGMNYVPDAPLVELLVPHRTRRAPTPVAKIIRVTAMPSTRTLRGVRVAAPERAALDAARGAGSLRAVRAVLCEVVQRRLATADRVAAELEVVDRRGMRLARRVVADLQAGCRSAPECELRDLVKTSTVLPEPMWNQPLPGAEGIVPDGHIEELRLILEVDSMEHHQFGEAPERTVRRRARLASLGWRVYPVSPRRIRDEPAAVLAEIEAAAKVSKDRAA